MYTDEKKGCDRVKPKKKKTSSAVWTLVPLVFLWIIFTRDGGWYVGTIITAYFWASIALIYYLACWVVSVFAKSREGKYGWKLIAVFLLFSILTPLLPTDYMEERMTPISEQLSEHDAKTIVETFYEREDGAPVRVDAVELKTKSYVVSWSREATNERGTAKVLKDGTVSTIERSIE